MSFRIRLSIGLVAVCCLLADNYGVALAAPAPAWVPIAGTGPTVLPREEDEVQQIAVVATGGSFRLGFGGEETPAIPFNASADEVEAALDTLGSVGPNRGSVMVKGGRGGPRGLESPYVVAFEGSLARSDQPEISADGAELAGEFPSATVSTKIEGGSGTSELATFIQNVGGVDSSGPLTLSGTLSEGLLLDGPATRVEAGWTCANATDLSSFTCSFGGTVGSGLAVPTPRHLIETAAGASAAAAVHLTVTGGGATRPGEFDLPLTIGEEPAAPGVQTFTAGGYGEEGELDTRAGGHPTLATTGIILNTVRSPLGALVPAGEAKDIRVELPAGFAGNATVTPTCPASVQEDPFGGEGGVLSVSRCPIDTIVGIAQPGTEFGGFGSSESPVINLEPPFGYPAAFKFKVQSEVIHVNAELRSDGDYGIDTVAANTPQVLPVFGVFFTFWGDPGDAVHDTQRCGLVGALPITCGASDAGEAAFLTNPSACEEEVASPPVTTLTVNTWERPDVFSGGVVGLPPVSDCDELAFTGTSTLQPSTSAADSPASFESTIAVPSEGLTDATKRAEPDLRKTVVRLPRGVTLNPSAADGLDSCSLEQVGYLGGGFPLPNPMRFSKGPNRCPEAAKIGVATLRTPLLKEPLSGAVYLADQGGGNPFGSLFAIYVVIEDPLTGIVVKLPGEVVPDKTTGQLTVTFDHLPQLPFSSLDLKIKGGDRSALATPETCGTYMTGTEFTPWSAPESGPPTNVEDAMAVDRGPNGGPCAGTPGQRPFGLDSAAGSASPVAGAHSAFSLRVTRPDGAQELTGFDLKMPPGAAATLKGIPYCSDADIAAARQATGRGEQADPSCPGASRVGAVSVGAGAGGKPFYVPGNLYLAGPYKGAPLSVVAITPAVAGPLDLGDVVVRSAVVVDPQTAQITAKTDPLPEFIEGVQLRIRDLRISLDRPGFALNPTDCTAKSVDLTVRGNSGATADLSDRFQVGGCENLAFKPRLHLKLKGGTRRNRYPALFATLTQRPGQANIGRVAVTLPRSEFLEQGHIKTICTRVQFGAVPRACPAKSVYGYAEAESPLLDYKLTGPVYLRSSDHKLPDLVAALKGPDSQPIEIDLVGRIDSKNGGIRNSFELVPDAPVSRFVLHMRGGRKGLLVNSTDLCRAKKSARRATARVVGQNDRRADQFPIVANQCHKHHRKRGRKHRAH